MSDFFCNKDIVAASPKKNFAAYSNAHFNGEDGSPKTWNLESGNGVTERNTESNIKDRKILYKNSLILKCKKTRITALFDDKATFMDTSKTTIFEWEVAILFIHLGVDKVVLVSMILQMLQQSPGDTCKQEDYSEI